MIEYGTMVGQTTGLAASDGGSTKPIPWAAVAGVAGALIVFFFLFGRGRKRY